MNTYALTDSNLPLIEKDLIQAKIDGFTTVRIMVTPAEMFSGGHIHFDLLDKCKSLFAKYNRKMCALVYADIAPQGFWVNQIADGRDPDDVFNAWKNEPSPNRSWKRPEGLPVELEDPVIEAFGTIIDYLKPDYVQPENEPGDTVNALRGAWKDSTPGYIHLRFRPFLNRLVDRLNGHTIISTAWETENEPTYAMQIDSGEGYWTRKCQIQGQNQYFAHWVLGDTPGIVAPRFWAKVRECAPYRTPVAVTEYNIVGIPPDKEKATLLEIKRTKPSWCKFCCPYPWAMA